MSAKRVFISVANSEFASLRAMLRAVLTRAGFDVVVQPDFPHTPTDTVRKLDTLIAPCDLLLHIVGKDAGSRAATAAVNDFFSTTPRETFVPDVKDRAFFDTLTYMQWEPWLALQRQIPVLVYGGRGHDAADGKHLPHLAALRGMRCHADKLMAKGARCGQIVADVCAFFKVLPPAIEPKLAPSRIVRHSPRVLFGREEWLKKLDDAWDGDTINVYTLVAWGGVGKTSLVAHWVNERFVKHGWPGVERYFDWSFYSQGTGESRQTSADFFINDALLFFGDPDPTKGNPWQRGERLAGLIRQHRTLLVLDGIEPLQYPPTADKSLVGQLKDPALASLVQSLAVDNPGLCIITTREHLTNVESYESTGTSHEEKLEKLFREAAIALLRHLQIVGTDEELAEAWKDADGHALTLQLLGRFIADAYPKDRDIRHYKQVKLAEADKERQGRSAFKVMRAYEKWLANEDADKQRELAILRLTGLFDRPISEGCMGALRAEPAIPKLTEPLAGLKETLWNIALSRLISVDLLSRTADDALDAHPIVREYFAEQLERDLPDTFKKAHSRLFDYLCTNTPERPDGVEGLAPLYQAVVHGCHAGRHEEACDDVYKDRILRGTGDDGFYSWHLLGAVGANLGLVAAFFVEPWSKVSTHFAESDRAWLLNEAGNYLRAMGRLTEALQPMRAGLQGYVISEEWRAAAISASNVSQLEVTLGQLTQAVADGRQSMAYTDQSGDAGQKMINRTTAADALHQAGDRATALELFAEAERMQAEGDPAHPLLYSLRGFNYLDLLLEPAERATWLVVLRERTAITEQQSETKLTCAEAERRAKQTLVWVTPQNWLVDIALDHLTLARAKLYRVLCGATTLPDPAQHFPECDLALSKMREANDLSFLPLALLTCGLYYGGLLGDRATAKRYLDEAERIAVRGPMPLYLADVHLHRARLFRDADELAKAAALIEERGYGRRREELADAKAALGGAATRP